MNFNSGTILLDAIVLSLVSAEDSYGYKITQGVRKVLDVSESTLYPVLRRLQKEDYLETYDLAFDGRNRRYYKITEKGRILLESYKNGWKEYRNKIDSILTGGSYE